MGRSECGLELDGPATIADVWARACPGERLDDNILVARNLEHAAVTQPVADGDEIAFFPPVTGG